MRVLHIGAGNMFGGVETLLLTLARCRHLCPEMEPSFALCFEGRLSGELSDTGVPLHFLGEVRASRYWTVLGARRRLRELLRQHSFDVVVTHMSWPHAIFAPEVTRTQLPLVNWVHGIPDGRHWLERWASRTPPRLVICNSRFTAGHVSAFFRGVAKEEVYYPVDPLASRKLGRSAVRRELGADDDTVVILQASRMEAWKGQELHLRALAQLRELPNWICWMAGGAQRSEERKYRARLQDQTVALAIADRVKFLGQRSDVPSLMAGADIFCQPNRDGEPFGIVFVEALQAGLPVVTTRMGGAIEIVEQSTGVLVPPGDSQALANCLRRLIDSPEERSRLSTSGPSRANALCGPTTQLAKIHASLQRATGPASLPFLRTQFDEAS